MSFLVAYDDGDLLEHDLDQEFWRYPKDGMDSLSAGSPVEVSTSGGADLANEYDSEDIPQLVSVPFQRSEAVPRAVEKTEGNPELPVKERWKRLFQLACSEFKKANEASKALSVFEKPQLKGSCKGAEGKLQNIRTLSGLAILSTGKLLEHSSCTARGNSSGQAKKRKICAASPTCLQEVDHLSGGRDFTIL